MKLLESSFKYLFALYRKKSTPWLGVGDANKVSAVRNLFAKLINAPSGECIAITYSTSFAMTVAVKNLYLSSAVQPGKNILLLEKEMGSVV